MGSNLNIKNFGIDMHPAAGGQGRQAGNFPLARQSSVYSLTFDEFQNTVGGIGKDFGSMNIDELLKNIWSAEENPNIGSTSGVDNIYNVVSQDSQRQGSLTLPRTLSQKTVEEVWRDIAKEYIENDPACGATGGFGVVQRQLTLGEVTLEEFLVRAGVVKEETQLAQRNKNFDLFVNEFGSGFVYQGSIADNSNLPLNVNGAAQQQQLLPKQQPVLAYPSNNNNNNQLINPGGISGGIIGISDAIVQNVMVGLGGNGKSDPCVSPAVSSDGLTRSNGDTPSVSPVPFVFNNAGGLRGRKSSALEKVVERRQKRMIKNRESAARSRARKQAYTMELEAEVAKLKEENELLQKKQAEMLEMQKSQRVLERMKQQNGNKRRCLRRTQTGPW